MDRLQRCVDLVLRLLVVDRLVVVAELRFMPIDEGLQVCFDIFSAVALLDVARGLICLGRQVGILLPLVLHEQALLELVARRLLPHGLVDQVQGLLHDFGALVRRRFFFNG